MLVDKQLMTGVLDHAADYNSDLWNCTNNLGTTYNFPAKFTIKKNIIKMIYNA